MHDAADANRLELPILDGDEDILRHEFCVETHRVDAMPAAHWHDHIELNYLWQGQLTYLINGRRLTLDAGRLCVFWAATPHQVIAVEDAELLSCAYMPLSFFLGLPLEPSFRQAILNGEVFYNRERDRVDEHLFERWTRDWRHAEPALRRILEDEVRLRVRRFSWSRTVASASRSEAQKMVLRSGRRAVMQAEKMATFIHDNLERPMNVSDVVRASGLHPTNANRAFQGVLGMTIGEYIRRHRFRHAMRLLVDTDTEISQVAYECGYSSVTRLYDAFQQRLGRTPRQYRLEFQSPPRAGA